MTSEKVADRGYIEAWDQKNKWQVEGILRHVLDHVACRGYIEACPRPGGR